MGPPAAPPSETRLCAQLVPLPCTVGWPAHTSTVHTAKAAALVVPPLSASLIVRSVCVCVCVWNRLKHQQSVATCADMLAFKQVTHLLIYSRLGTSCPI